MKFQPTATRPNAKSYVLIRMRLNSFVKEMKNK